MAAGGRVYLAKDSRVDPAAFRSMYPEVDQWLAVKDRVDPDGVLRSDLGRRLGLCTDKQPSAPAQTKPGPGRAKSGASKTGATKPGATKPAKAPAQARARRTTEKPDQAPDTPHQNGPPHDRRRRATPVSPRTRRLLPDRPGHRGPTGPGPVPDGDPGR